MLLTGVQVFGVRLLAPIASLQCRQVLGERVAHGGRWRRAGLDGEYPHPSNVMVVCCVEQAVSKHVEEPAWRGFAAFGGRHLSDSIDPC